MLNELTEDWILPIKKVTPFPKRVADRVKQNTEHVTKVHQSVRTQSRPQREGADHKEREQPSALAVAQEASLPAEPKNICVCEQTIAPACHHSLPTRKERGPCAL